MSPHLHGRIRARKSGKAIHGSLVCHAALFRHSMPSSLQLRCNFAVRQAFHLPHWQDGWTNGRKYDTVRHANPLNSAAYRCMRWHARRPLRTNQLDYFCETLVPS